VIYLLISFLSSFLICLLLIKVGSRHLEDHTHGVQKVHTWSALRAGGVAIFTALLITFTAFHIAGKGFAGESFLVLISCLPVFVGGLLEDLTKRVSPRMRLGFAFLSGLLAGIVLDAHLTRVDVPLLDGLLTALPIFSLLFTAFALAGVSNAVNIIDGFNGLASGVGIIVFLGYAYVSFLVGDLFLLYLSLAAASALLGFFFWNYPYGYIFLGDSGAYTVGFLAGLVGVLLVNEHPQVSAWFPLTLLFYPIWETLFSIVRRRFLHRNSPMKPDAKHFHSLVYRRLVRFTFGRTAANPSVRNPLTSPYLWIMQILVTVPALIFWKHTLILMVSCAAFAVFYTWLYFRIVRFRTPKVLRVMKVGGSE